MLPWRDAEVIHQIGYISGQSELPRVPCNSFTESTGSWIALRVPDLPTCQQPYSCTVLLGMDHDWRNEGRLPLITSSYSSSVRGRDPVTASYYQCNDREVLPILNGNVSAHLLILEQPSKALKWALLPLSIKTELYFVAENIIMLEVSFRHVWTTFTATLPSVYMWALLLCPYKAASRLLAPYMTFLPLDGTVLVVYGSAICWTAEGAKILQDICLFTTLQNYIW